MKDAGTAGADAPWSFEPTHWYPAALVEGRTPDAAGDTSYQDYSFEISKEAARRLDARFREEAMAQSDRPPDAHAASFEAMARALAPESPFRRFHVWVYEWETGYLD